MTNLVWITDPHLNFLPAGCARVLGETIRKSCPTSDGVVVTGDIAEAHSFAPLLGEFAEGYCGPVWFVLGNHDAYGGSVTGSRIAAGAMVGRAMYLPGVDEFVPVGDNAGLVGVDGWYDARNGKTGGVLMSDFYAIEEFRGQSDQARVARAIADHDAAVAQAKLTCAAEAGAKRVLFATHVPPYVEAAWHEGRPGNDAWSPWMSSQVMGDTLDQVAAEYPDVAFTVLCGHTHSPGVYHRQPNLTVYTGQSTYGKPCVSGLIVDGEVRSAW